MADTLTYDSLLGDLRSYIERGFTEASDPLVYTQLPRLVVLGQRRIARELKLQGFLVPVTTILPANTTVLAKPDRWRETVSMRTIDGNIILPRSYEYLRNYWPVESETGTEVEFYADYDYEHWLLIPAQTTSTALEILYWQLPQLIDDANQTNWLTAYAPELLLYACLLETAPYLKNDTRIPVWQQLYERAAQALATEDIEKIMDRSAERTTS